MVAAWAPRQPGESVLDTPTTCAPMRLLQLWLRSIRRPVPRACGAVRRWWTACGQAVTSATPARRNTPGGNDQIVGTFRPR